MFLHIINPIFFILDLILLVDLNGRLKSMGQPSELKFDFKINSTGLLSLFQIACAIVLICFILFSVFD